MTRDEAVDEIRAGLGFRSDMQATIISRLKQSQRELEGGKSLPWFIVNEDSPIELIAGQSEYTLSDHFIQEADDLGFQNIAQNIEGDIYHVKKWEYDKSIATFGFEATGYPRVYTIRNFTLKFFPTPDIDYSYRWSFYQKQTTLEDNVENQWLKFVPDLLIGMAGGYVAANLRDEQAIAYFQPIRQNWEAWLIKQIAQRQVAVNERTVMGSDR